MKEPKWDPSSIKSSTPDALSVGPVKDTSLPFEALDRDIIKAFHAGLKEVARRHVPIERDFLKYGTLSEAHKAEMRLKDIEAATKDPITLADVWRKRDEDKYHPKFHEVWYSEELRRVFEKRMGRVMTREDIEKILRALLAGEIELR